MLFTQAGDLGLEIYRLISKSFIDIAEHTL
jgi:hypothetical protein